ncbi:MAG: hypothetical protein WAX38_00280 [Minisyncoccia bacterium]
MATKKVTKKVDTEGAAQEIAKLQTKLREARFGGAGAKKGAGNAGVLKKKIAQLQTSLRAEALAQK